MNTRAILNWYIFIHLDEGYHNKLKELSKTCDKITLSLH